MATKRATADKKKAKKTKKAKKAAQKQPAKKKQAAKTKTSSGLKTSATTTKAAVLLSTLAPAVRADCEKIDGWMAKAAGAPGVLWGKAIVGYGSRTLRYDSGRELEWMKIGFSPRAQAITLYLPNLDKASALLAKLGKHTTGKGCLYVKRLDDVDAAVLQQLIAHGVRAS